MMPMRVAQQPPVSNGTSYNLSTKSTDNNRTDDTASGAEGRARKRFQKSTSSNNVPATRTTVTSSARTSKPQSNFISRRTSIREAKAPLGPRPPDYSPSRTDSLRTIRNLQSSDSTNTQSEQISLTSTREPSRPLSKGGEGSDLLGSFDFEPALNFDDLHTSLTSEDPQLSQFPTPVTGGTILSRQNSGATNISRQRNDIPEPAIGAGGPRFGSNGSVVRRQSIIAKQNAGSSSSTNMDPPTATIPLRSRRQSHFPPPTSSNPVSRPPRKSIGPGVIDGDFPARAAQRRRPSLVTSTDSISSTNHEFARSAARISVSGGSLGDKPGFLTTSRNVKTKSLQPLPKASPDPNALYTPIMTPDHARSSFISQSRSPGKSPGRSTNTPSSSSSKRLSVMPAHAMSGLGARTISPTDARRMKRLSTLPNPPPMPNTPPTPQPEASELRATSHSPSMIPRKSVTPSSSRTTPEQNRKSYSSGLSTSSNASLNSLRNTTASTLQTRQTQNSSTSRLPTPKTRNVHSSAGAEEEEVPPVPAIPKAYESPKDFSDSPFTISRKSSLKFEPSSSANTSGGEHDYASFRRRDQLSVDRETRLRRGQTIAISTDVEKKTRVPATSTQKNLQPLRLPPLNLLPLSTPTVSKVAALQDHSADHRTGNVTPPRRDNIKTPATPLTASRATFFSRIGKDCETTGPIHHGRSNSTTLTQRSDSLHHRAPSTASSMAPPPPYSKHDRQAQSPFVSSSLPKSNSDYQFNRPNTSGEYTPVNSSTEPRSSRLNGPRAQTSIKTSKDDPALQSSSPSERETPTSTSSSIRRKLSIGWKRSSSKNSQAATDRDAEYPQQGSKHDDMPPPRLPASATWSNGLASSPSPIAKATSHFERRRRKSSASSLNALAAAKSDTTDAEIHHRTVRKESNDNIRSTPSGSRSTSILAPMHKMLNSKSSNGAMKAKMAESGLDRDDQAAEDEMKKLASKRKDFEIAANEVDELRKRATPKDRVTPAQAVRMVNLNIFERGEIVDYKEVYFCGTKDAKKHVGDLNAQSANFGYDDDRGDYNIVHGDHLSYRYEIVDILGKGSFGQVVRCVDHKTGGLVAVKIIRNKKRFHQQALVEVNILQKLREWDPHNRHSMVNFTQSFYFRGHLCISTELLGMNLYEFIKSNDFRGFSLKLIRRFTKQLLSSLVLLKSHKVIHCDLKPENVLLAHPVHSEIKVIDFGSSCFENEKVYTYIQSRFYRSPEVILGMTYGLPIDMWSVGCILAELFSGFPIFPGENEQEQLACIMEVFGPPEKHLIEKSTRKKLFFDSVGKPRLTVSSKGRRRRPSSRTLAQTIKCDDEAFLDFIARCLRWDPERRLKPDEACHHEFITGIKKSTRTKASTAANTESPLKRTTIAQTPGSIRPLPEPPATALKNGSAVRNREIPSSSPSKANHAKRHSIVNSGPTTIGVKRTSTGATVQNTSLPRVAATRSMSAKTDLATAAAAISLQRPR